MGGASFDRARPKRIHSNRIKGDRPFNLPLVLSIVRQSHSASSLVVAKVEMKSTTRMEINNGG